MLLVSSSVSATPQKPPSLPYSELWLGLGRVIDPKALGAQSQFAAGVGQESLHRHPPPTSTPPRGGLEVWLCFCSSNFLGEKGADVKAGWGAFPEQSGRVPSRRRTMKGGVVTSDAVWHCVCLWVSAVRPSAGTPTPYYEFPLMERDPCCRGPQPLALSPPEVSLNLSL